jgi:hypothetical protein
MREPVIKSYAERVIAHAASKGGSCRQGFVNNLVNGPAQVAPFMRIRRNDINNKVRAIQGQGPHKCEQREVSPAPATPFHVIHDPSLSKIFGLIVSASSNAKTTTEQNCAKWLSSGPAWQEVEFTLRYRVSNSPVESAIFLSCFLHLWVQKLPAEHRPDCAEDTQQPASSGATTIMTIGYF